MVDLLSIGLSTLAKELATWIREHLPGKKKQATNIELEPFVVASRLHRLSDPDRRLYVFDLRVANRAELPNGVASIALWISYRRRSDVPSSNASFSHQSTLAQYLTTGSAPFNLPMDIPARSVRSELAPTS